MMMLVCGGERLKRMGNHNYGGGHDDDEDHDG